MSETNIKKKRSRQRSLQGKVFRISLIGGSLLGVVALIIGLGIYAFVLADQYIEIAFNLSQTTSIVIEKVIDIQSIVDEVLSIYHGLSEEERAFPKDPDYLARYTPVTERKDYKELVRILREYKNTNDVADLFVQAYDLETSAAIYIADMDENPDNMCPTGCWEEMDEETVEGFQNWDGGEKLYEIGYMEEYGWVCTSGVPFRDAEGNVICYILADVSLVDLLKGMSSFVLWYIIALAGIITVYILIVLHVMKKSVVRPINRVSEAAKQYTSDKLSGAEKDDHFTALKSNSVDEIENLASTMADMEKDMGNYVENLMRVTKEKEKIEAELSVAAMIQADMLPNTFPAFPDRDEFDLYAKMDPAKEVGGDFYDFFLIDEDHLCLLIADVSDKGVPAALFMMSAKIMINYRAREGGTPAEILTAVNEQLSMNNNSFQFVTVWMGILEISSGKMVCANAGHEKPFIRGKDGVFRMYKDKNGYMLGVLPNTVYTDYELALEPGNAVFVYTDGVPEACNSEREFYGLERLEEVLNRNAHEAPQKILENVRKDVDSLVNGAKQFDDLTMLCLEYNYSACSCMLLKNR